MQSELSEDGQDIVRELTASLTRAVGTASPEFGRMPEYTAAAFERIRRELDEGGWNELLAQGAGGDEDNAVIARAVEEIARGNAVLAFPLADNVIARRLLSVLGQDAAGNDVAVADVSLATVWHDAPPVFPFPDDADRFLAFAGPEGADEFDIVEFGRDDLVPTEHTIDATRPLGRPRSDRPGSVVGTVPAATARRLAAEALLLTAAELLGAGDRLAALTRTYLSEREQFSRRLSGFQALRHRVVNVFVQLETLRSLVWYTAWTADRVPGALHEYALIAKGFGAEVAWPAADEAIQLFGGMGFTWEQGLHFPAARIASLTVESPTAAECLEQVGRRSVLRGGLVGLIA